MTYIAHAYKTITMASNLMLRQMEHAVHRFRVRFYSFEDNMLSWNFVLENAVVSC